MLGRTVSATRSSPITLYHHDLFDHMTNTIPTIGMNTSPRVPDRFLSRLSEMTGTTALLDEYESRNAIHVCMVRKSGSGNSLVEHDDELRLLLGSIQMSLTTISTQDSGMFIVYVS